MPKIKLNPLFAQISGKMGNVVFKRSKKGLVYISRLPEKSTAKASEAQLAQRKVFTKAVPYAKSARADEAMWAFYETLAERRDSTARALCMQDYLNAPSMDDLDLSGYHGQAGDHIRITTHDDVGVVRVNVKLTQTHGALIEYGKAVERFTGSGEWEYVATVSVPPGTTIRISAEAFDRPGNRAVASANPIVGESHSDRLM